MNPQDPLAALNPLRDPSQILWWPLAPGWWVVIILCLLVIAFACYTVLRRYRASAYRRQALQQLRDIRSQGSNIAQGNERNQSLVKSTNFLLKAVALRAYPRADIAALSGDAWQEFLKKTVPATTKNFPDGFAQASYQRRCDDLDEELLFTASEYWIAKHRPAS